MQVQGQQSHQWAPFQVAVLLHTWQISSQVCLSWGSIAKSFHSLQSLSVSHFHVILGLPGPHFLSTCMSKAVLTASLEHAHVHTSRAFSPSEWGPDPQCQTAQVAHWIWWWQCLAAWHCRSVWSLSCHFTADDESLALSMAKSHWHGALHSAHKSCTCGHVSWKGGGRKTELVAAPWTSSKQFSHMLWLKLHSYWLLRACLLGNKRKLPPPACQVRLGRNLTFSTLVEIFSRQHFEIFFLIVPRKQDLTYHANCLH